MNGFGAAMICSVNRRKRIGYNFIEQLICMNYYELQNINLECKKSGAFRIGSGTYTD